MELIESESRVKQANEQREDYRKKFEQIKREMINMKKAMDKHQADTLHSQQEELQNLKTQIINRDALNEQKSEITQLKMALMQVTSKLQDSSRSAINGGGAGPAGTINDR